MADSDNEGPQATPGEPVPSSPPEQVGEAPAAFVGPSPTDAGTEDAQPAAGPGATDYWSRVAGAGPAAPVAPVLAPASGSSLGDTVYGPPLPAPTPKPRRSARRTFAYVLTAVVLVLVGTGVAIYAVNGDGTNPKNAVETAVANLHRAKTAEVALALSINAGGQSFKITGNGVTNVLTNATNETIIYNLAGTRFTARAIIDGSTAYFNYGPGVGRIVPGKSWVSMDLGQSGASGSQGTGVYSDPSAMVAVLGAPGTAIRALGSSNVNGVAVQGYSIDLGPAGIERALRSTDFPSKLKSALRLSHFSRLDYIAYVDASNRLSDVRTVEDYSVDGQQFTAQGDMSLSDYGIPVSISDPPPSEVIPFQQFQKIEAQSQGTASS